MLDTLRRLHALGFSLIQLRERDKRPAGSWQKYQHEVMPWPEIEARYNDRPNANWGVVTGSISNLVVVDVDPRNGGDIEKTARWLSELCDGDTFTVLTGGGGAHFYLALNGTPLATRPSFTPGVDLKAEGGYVVAPGGVHPNGTLYVIAKESPVREAPRALFASPPPAATPASSISEHWIADTLAAPEKVPQGSQETTMTRLAYYLAGNMPQDIARGMLLQWSRGLVVFDAHWPWTEDDVDRHLESAYMKRGRTPRLRIGGLTTSEVPATSVPLRDQVQTAAEFCKATQANVEWVVEGLLAPGCLTELIGSVKAGKSTWVCGMLWSILNGQPWLGKATKPTRVLFVTEQAGPSFRQTLHRGRIDESEDLFVLTPKELFGRDWDDAVTGIIDAAQACGAKLIVIDTLARLAGLAGDDENSAGVAMRVLRPFQAIKAHDLSVLFVRHGRKSGGALNELGRGSNAYSGEMDVMIGLRVIDKFHKEMEVSGRLDEPWDAVLEYENGTYRVSDDPRETRNQVKDNERTALLLDQLAERPLSAKSLATNTKMGQQTVERLLNPLVGESIEKKKGKYKLLARLHIGGKNGEESAE